ncbi:protein IMPACT-A-like [Diachasmimorpha longicaudata]|uniref:protein IMPACT-A-like n=1 Tax=Diachasmimorpha longicaudata TaxID=58733 RepID=UPI0030B8B877
MYKVAIVNAIGDVTSTADAPQLIEYRGTRGIMDNLAQQADEIEALVAIYGDELVIEDEENRAYSINIGEGGCNVKLYLKLPIDYPSSVPPVYEVSAPHLRQEQKSRICRILDEVYLDYVGQNVIYQWVERIREELQNLNNQKEGESHEDVEECKEENDLDTNLTPAPVEETCPEIYHGEVVVDRKSFFQGHTARVTSVAQIKLVLKKLMENRKVEQATHNMYAYRLQQEKTTNYLQDCEDDGENQAGGRLLHLLQILDAKDVLVVVSRWYGGIHLGPDRFRHINNAARLVLEAAGIINRSKNKK